MGWDYSAPAEPLRIPIETPDCGALRGMVVGRDEAGRIDLELHYPTRLHPQGLTPRAAVELARALLEAAGEAAGRSD